MSLSYLQTSLDKLDAASRDDVIEICINPDGTCWGEFQGDHFMRLLDQRLSETAVKDLGNQIASSANTTMSKDRPIVSVSIAYKDRPIRAQVITPPAAVLLACALCQTETTVRCFRGKGLRRTAS